VGVKALLKRRSDRENDQRDDCKGKGKVCEEDQEVECPRPSGVREDHMPDMIMIIQITPQKGSRGDYRGDHAESVGNFSLGPDHDPTQDN